MLVVSALQAQNPGAGVARYQREIATSLLKARARDIEVLISGAFAKDLVTRNMALTTGTAVSVPFPRLRVPIELATWYKSASHLKDFLSLDLATLGRWRRCSAVVHDLSFQYEPAWYTVGQRLWKNHCIRRLVRKADAVACVSQHVADELCNRYPQLADRVKTIRSAIPRLPAPSRDDVTAVRSRMRHYQWNILQVGTLTPQKMPIQFVDSVLQLRKMGYDVHGWLVGRLGWNAKKILRRVSEGVKEGSLTWLGSVSDGELAAFYRAADLVVHCSLYEGFGFVPGEALLSGGRVLSRRLPSIVEYLGDSVEYFDSNSPADLSEIIRELLGKHPNRSTSLDLDRNWEAVTSDLISLAKAA